MVKRKKEYTLYLGEEIIGCGTVEELSEKTGYKKSHIWKSATASYKVKTFAIRNQGKKAIYAVVLDMNCELTDLKNEELYYALSKKLKNGRRITEIECLAFVKFLNDFRDELNERVMNNAKSKKRNTHTDWTNYYSS